VVIRLHDPEGEIIGIDDQRRSDQVAVNGVASCTPPSLDFQSHPEVAMNAINVVTDARSPLLTEQDREGDSIGELLAGLDLEPEALQSRAQSG